ncbi:MAG: 2-nitropropane dioxygenase [Bacteroidetes bacterium]|nr:2-nitropropane dioxygenase [Bacteroidota bacterium]
MGNRICEILEIQTPIISGGMVWCSGWELASAVSNEGGLGLIGAGSMTPEILVEHIHKCRKATTNTFGVNIPLMNPNSPKHIDIVIQEKIPVVFTSAGNPATYTQRLKQAGIKVVHVIANEKFARKAQEAGVDAVVAEGFEAGGHNGKEETTTLVLVDQIVKALDIPVIAAGGIASGEQWLAMNALGAEGVQIGSLFASSNESSAHENFKKAVIDAREGDTLLFFRKLSPTRLLKGGFFNKIQEAESRGASKEELLEIIGVGRSRKGIFEGDLEEGELEIGQVSSLINNELSVKEIFIKLKQEYTSAKQRLTNIQ